MIPEDERTDPVTFGSTVLLDTAFIVCDAVLHDDYDNGHHALCENKERIEVQYYICRM